MPLPVILSGLRVLVPLGDLVSFVLLFSHALRAFVLDVSYVAYVSQVL